MSEQEKKQKLEEMQKNIPSSLEDVFQMSTEGRTLFDTIAMLLGGDTKETISILERSNLRMDECTTIADALVLAKWGLNCDGTFTPAPDEWAIPRLRDKVIFILKGRPSINGNSRSEAVGALNGVRESLNANRRSNQGSLSKE